MLAVVQTVVVVIFAAQSTVEADAVRERISALPADARWLVVAGSDAQIAPKDAGRLARTALRELSSGTISMQLVFGPLSDQRGGRYQLIASRTPAAQVTLTQGRWPSRCDTSGCEVLLIGARSTPAPSALRVVGHAEFRPLDERPDLGLDATAPVLLAGDPEALLRMPAYHAVPHTLQWSAPLGIDRIGEEGINGFLNVILRASDQLSLADPRLQLSAPTTQLNATAAQVQALQQRMLGLAICLLLIGCYSVHRIAVANRRDFGRVVALSREFGWTRLERASFTAATACFAVLPAVAVGIALGSAIGTVAFAGRFAFNGVAQWSLALAITAIGALVTGLQGRASVRRGVLAIALSAWLLAAWRGGYDLEVLALSAVGAIVGALIGGAVPLVAARVRMPPFTRNLLRANAHRLTAFTLIVGFLTAFVMGSTASLETLRQGSIDSAVFESPLAARIAWADRLPMQGRTLADYSAMTDGGRVFPVHTVTARVRQSIVDATPLQLVGVDPQAWKAAPDFTHQTGVSNASIAQLLGARSQTLGAPLRGSGTLRGHVAGLSAQVALSAWIFTSRHEAVQVAARVQADGGFVVDLPCDAVSLLGFGLDELPDASAHRSHAVGEGDNTLVAPHGTLRLDRLEVDGARLRLTAASDGMPGVLSVTERGLKWSYVLVGGSGWAPLVNAPRQLRGIVDAATAAQVRDNMLAVRINDATVLRVRVVGVADRLPTAAPHFLLMDGGAMEWLLAANAPGLLRVSEVWTSRPLARDAASTALVGLRVVQQREVAAGRAASSATHWSERTLLLLITVAMGVLLSVIALTRRDLLLHAEVDGWRGQGSTGATMARAIRRVILVLVTATAVLTALGILVAVPAVVGYANLDITGSPAVPPLHAVRDLRAFGAIVLGTLCVALVATTRAGFRDHQSSGRS